MAKQMKRGPSISLELIVNDIDTLTGRVADLADSPAKQKYLRFLGGLKEMLLSQCDPGGQYQYIPFNLGGPGIGA